MEGTLLRNVIMDLRAWLSLSWRYRLLSFAGMALQVCCWNDPSSTSGTEFCSPITGVYVACCRNECDNKSSPVISFTWKSCLGCRKRGCNKLGFKGCLAALSGNRPKSAFFALFLPFSPFSRGCNEHLGNPENGGKRPFSSDILRFA